MNEKSRGPLLWKSNTSLTWIKNGSDRLKTEPVKKSNDD